VYNLQIVEDKYIKTIKLRNKSYKPHIVDKYGERNIYPTIKEEFDKIYGIIILM